MVIVCSVSGEKRKRHREITEKRKITANPEMTEHRETTENGEMTENHETTEQRMPEHRKLMNNGN